jgi:penicillin amidase
MRAKPFSTIGSIPLVALLVLSACGAGDDGGGDPAATPTTQATETAEPTATEQVLATETATPARTATVAPASATPTTTPTGAATATPTNPVLNRTPDEVIQLPGLPAGTAYVAFDSLGMPHIYADDVPTGLFVQGYETAKVRFWQMDAFRRVAEGRLSELFGALTLDMDIEMRTVFTTRDGRRLEQALWERLEEEGGELLASAQAYSDGINAWLDDLRNGRNGAVLPPEYSLVSVGPEDLDDWHPRDSLAIGRLQAYSLSETLGEELGAAERIAALPDALLRDVFRSAPATDATVLPVATSPASVRTRQVAACPSEQLPALDLLRNLREMFDRNERFNPLGGRDRGTGSNNWIVSPSLSANGHAMMANDPHLQLFNPAIWHMVQLNSGGMQVTGENFPGLPGIILGHNAYGAWGGTVAVFDVTDIYMEQVTTPLDYPNSPRTVLFNGEQVEVLRVEEEIGLAGGSAATIIIEVVPHHGPMVPDPDRDDDIVGLAATNMSVRWTGHEITTDSRFLNELNQARNVEEFKQAVRSFAVGAQNWVWADVNGDIAYFPYTLVPQRPEGTIPYLPMDGTGSAEWLVDNEGNTLWLPEEKFPQATNPPEGFLATSNNDQLGNTLDNDPLNDDVYFTFSADLGFRQQRILDLLSNRAGLRPDGAKISREDISAYQYDTVSLEASRLLPFLFEAADLRSDLLAPGSSDALQRLQEWGVEKEGSPAWTMASGVDPAEGRTDISPRPQPVSDEEKADAVAASIFAAWSTRVTRSVFIDDFAGTGIGSPGGQDATKALLHILEDIESTDPNFVVHTKGENGESTLWDDKNTPDVVETRDEILVRALNDARTFLTSQLGSDDPQDWLWGKLHQVRYQHFFGQAGVNAFDIGNFAAPGGRFTVNPAGYSLNANEAASFVFSNGPSKRFVTVLDPAGVHSVNALPGGNNGNPCIAGDIDGMPCGLTPASYNHINPETHYGDLIPGWINGDVFEYRVSPEAVADDTELLIAYEGSQP